LESRIRRALAKKGAEDHFENILVLTKEILTTRAHKQLANLAQQDQVSKEEMLSWLKEYSWINTFVWIGAPLN